MNKIAKFHKVSKEQFFAALKREDEACYGAVTLPRRATVGSAGYDFFAPFTFTLSPGEEITVPTGIRAEIQNGWVLMLYPRSGLGFKYRLRLNNTVGVIDSDYFYSDNEGHIMIRIANLSPDKVLTVEVGQGFAQGIFTPFGITTDDDADGVRNGGFGSTGK